MPTRSQAEATAVRKALAFLKSVKVETRGRKDIQRLTAIARNSFDLADYTARIASANKAQRILNAVAAAIRAGDLQADRLDGAKVREIAGKGIAEASAQVVFQNTLRTAYNAGRFEQQLNDRTKAFLLYRTMGDARVRPNHDGIDGVMLPKQAPFWKSHYPPNGHNCRCRVDSLTKEQAARLAEAPGIRTTPPKERQRSYLDTVTGETLKTPESIDPGWIGAPALTVDKLEDYLARSVKRLEQTS